MNSLLIIGFALAALSVGEKMQSLPSRGGNGEEIVWQADHETGDVSQWDHLSNSGNCHAAVSREHVHSGKFALKLTIDTSAESGCRCFRSREASSGKPYYYSAWFFIPEHYRPKKFWNIFQFKSKRDGKNDPVWVINVAERPNTDALHLRLSWIGNIPGPFSQAQKGFAGFDQKLLDVPVGRWFRVDAYLAQSSNFHGRLRIWQDGTLLWDLDNVNTTYSGGKNTWSVNNYSDGLSPNPATIYIDDAVISTVHIGGIQDHP